MFYISVEWGRTVWLSGVYLSIFLANVEALLLSKYLIKSNTYEASAWDLDFLMNPSPTLEGEDLRKYSHPATISDAPTAYFRRKLQLQKWYF